MKIATFNINNVVRRLPNLLDWLEEARPDAVCLQELKAEDGRFPAAELERAAREAGAEIRTGAEVTSVTPDGEVHVGGLDAEVLRGRLVLSGVGRDVLERLLAEGSAAHVTPPPTPAPPVH